MIQATRKIEHALLQTLDLRLKLYRLAVLVGDAGGVK